MSNRQSATDTQPSTEPNIVEQAHDAGLTDDERVRREEQSEGEGPRVNPGPADLERL